MTSRISLILKNYDWIAFTAIFLLTVFGLAEIYSIALGNENMGLANFKKQLFFAGFGIAVYFAASLVNYYHIRSFGKVFYLIAVFILVLVLFLGQTVRGTTGWFDLGWFNIQPVEFAKFFYIVFLAKFFSERAVRLHPIRNIALSGFYALVLIALVLMQPDFGSALLIFIIWGSMVFVAGFEKKYFFMIFFFLLVIFACGWFFYFEQYQKDRILTFIYPEKNLLGQGYNVAQAIIAVGSGGLTGRGLGFGSQSQLKFLPEAQNDFIFAVIAEELGFFGVMLVLIFFGTFFFRVLIKVGKLCDDFSAYFMFGAVSLLFAEMFINIGMNIGLLPVVGISLPFVSYGGSSLISSFLIAGVMQGIAARKNE